ncbi:MAG: FecR domain-containing protein [Sphingobacterium sp.]|jgi:hypothetical protein|nr:FecR domain-containing protein [Sphingobacterium sp.]
MKLTDRIHRSIQRIFERKALPEDKHTIDKWYNNFEPDTLYLDEKREIIKKRMLDRIQQPRISPKRYFLRYSVAAAALLIFSCLSYLYFYRSNTLEISVTGPQLTEINLEHPNLVTSSDKKNILIVDQKVQSITTPRAQLYRISLEDGTRVWLNAGSRLEKINFDGQQRQVKLTGEAYFEVAKDAKRPFSIQTPQQTVTVLGTKFNLKSYTGQKEVLSLVEGSVHTIDKHAQSIVLTAGESIEIQNGQLNKQDLRENNLAWKDQIFAFEEENLSEILDKVSKWYNVPVDAIPDSGRRYSGKIHTQAKLQEVLDMLSLVSQKKIILDKNRIALK